MPVETDCLLLRVMWKPFAWRSEQLRGLEGRGWGPRGRGREAELSRKRMLGPPPNREL